LDLEILSRELPPDGPKWLRSLACEDITVYRVLTAKVATLGGKNEFSVGGNIPVGIVKDD